MVIYIFFSPYLRSGLCEGLREIEYGEFLMVFFGCLVICLCGLDFVVKLADVFAFVVVAYLDLPFLISFGPVNALVFRW